MLNLFKIFGKNVKMSKVIYSQRWEWQTRLPFPSLTVCKIKKNLENVPRNLDDLKYRGTFIVEIYNMLCLKM